MAKWIKTGSLRVVFVGSYEGDRVGALRYTLDGQGKRKTLIGDEWRNARTFNDEFGATSRRMACVEMEMLDNLNAEILDEGTEHQVILVPHRDRRAELWGAIDV